MRSPTGQLLLPFLALVGGAIAMGISPIFVRYALADGVGPYASAFWRVGLALPLLYGWMRSSERDGAAQPLFTRAAVLAGLTFAGDLFFWHLAIQNTSVANATFFATTAPVWVVVAGFVLFGRRASLPVLIGILLCLIGGAALVLESMAVKPGQLVGDTYGVLTAVFFGLYFLCIEAGRREMGAARITFIATLITAAILLLAALMLDSGIWPRSWQGWAALIAMAWLSHAGGQGLLSVALGRLPAAFSSLVIFLEAVAAALFAWALLGEAVTAMQAVGGLVILIGIYIARPK